MEAPKTAPKDSSTSKPRATKRSSLSRKADSLEVEEEVVVPNVVQLVPIASPVLQPQVEDTDGEDMRDRPMYSPSFNPDDLFAFPFPYVPPLSHEALDKRFRASRAQIQGDAYQALFRDLVRPSQSEADVPCGSCPCCQRMLSYVSSLRTVLDHMVSDIVQKSPAGTRVAPCVLCLQEHREHANHEEQLHLAQPQKRDKRPHPQDVPAPQTSTPRGSEGQVEGHRRVEDSQARPRRSSTTRPARQHAEAGHREGQQNQPARNDPQTSSRLTKEDNSTGPNDSQSQQRSGSDRQHTQPTRKDFEPSQSPPTHDKHDYSSPTRSDEPRTTSPPPESPVVNGSHILHETPSTPHENFSSSTNQTLHQQAERVEERRPPSPPPRHEDRQAEDRTWREARAQLLEPPSLSPRDNQSPVVIHGGQYIFPTSDPDRPQNEAYVTIASDNLTALCCLVLGNSLRLTDTTRSLAVIVTDGVSGLFRHLLQSIFDVVQGVGVMDSQGSTKLALLEQPELGVSFTKPYVWSLDQFTKCVFLESDTLVVQNCDELFERDELSAVPDIGWPDCFNSGVFVFTPSQETFWKLIHFAEQQDSFDGGDQGLLNVFFRNWASDISHKLPFLYNLMANVSYTYKPAFKQFGSRVKIVHFFGSYKPWNVQFHPKTGQMAPGSNVHPTYAQFVHFWLEIYTKRVLPIFSKEIQDHMYSQEYACPHEVLQFIPSPVRRQESLPTPPSFRVYSGDKPREQPSIIDSILKLSFETKDNDAKPDQEAQPEEDTAGNRKEEETHEEESGEPEDPDVIPGADIDDFQNMAAWEQGRMDYMGQAKSNTIMKRLDFLIHGKR